MSASFVDQFFSHEVTDDKIGYVTWFPDFVSRFYQYAKPRAQDQPFPWASIIGWTGGHAPPLVFEVGGT